MGTTEISDRSRTAALALGVFTGVFGGHRYYVGKVGTGLLQLCTLGGLGIWWLYDCILIGVGEFRDRAGRRVARWGDEDVPGARPTTDPRLLEEVDHLRSEMFELQERVDFLERTLTQVRARPGVPPGQA